FSFNLNTVLALVTVIGGAFLVSGRLTSQRPAASSGSAAQNIGEQTLDARLWEDPLASFEKDAKQAAEAGDALGRLTEQIRTRRLIDTNAVLVLPVTVPGGPYSEDRESRIRSRFAVVSALSEAGYAPSDAEHLGIAALPWPTTAEIQATHNPGPITGEHGTNF